MADIISTINLCSVPITPTNQIDFETVMEQEEYFNRRTVKTCYPCKYTARTGSIKVKGYVDSFDNCNYGYYNNTYNGISKTFYFWIVQKYAKSKNTTELVIQIDVFQTWLFDLTFKSCFIERMHVTDDSIGVNTYPEDFELGDYIQGRSQYVDDMKGDICYFIGISEGDGGGVFGKKYSGLTYYYFPKVAHEELSTFIQNLCNDGKGDSIAYIFAFPMNMLKYSVIGNSLNKGDAIGGIEGTLSSELTFDLNLYNVKFNNSSYKPFNNKLFTYPYNFITAYNSEGGNVVWKLENFDLGGTEHIEMKLDTVFGENPVFSLSPMDYNDIGVSYQDSISTQGYGLCSWNNDNFANWYAQNKNSYNAQSVNASQTMLANAKVNQRNYETSKANNLDNYNTATDLKNIQLASDLTNSLSLDFVNMLGDAATSGYTYYGTGLSNDNTLRTGNRSNKTDLANSNLLNIVNYENTMRSLLASMKDAQVQPNTARGDTSCCGLDVARDTIAFYLVQTTIKPEYAKRIDLFFQMYGYQVNVIGTPKIRTRMKWNYVKTTNCTCMGNVPMEDRNAFENLFNNGLTIWHDELYMYEYDTENKILK